MKKNILKGVLLWATVLSILLFMIAGANTLAEQGEWLWVAVWALCNICLVQLCLRHLSFKDVRNLSGSKWADKMFD